jgi:hypothetical protein
MFILPEHLFMGLLGQASCTSFEASASLNFLLSSVIARGTLPVLQGGEYEMCAQGISDLEIAFVCDLRELLE